jgi:hypothetical protein
MRIVTLFIFIQSIAFFACKKDNSTPDAISGSWKLVEVYDKSTATYIDSPQGASGSITINFDGQGKFSGKTFRNTLSNGTYYLKSDKEIIFGIHTSTLVLEDEWGGPFQTVLNFCSLSSSAPCSPSYFFIKNGVLSINAPIRYNIKLIKL